MMDILPGAALLMVGVRQTGQAQGSPGKADVGDVVLGLQPRQVVVLDLDPAGAELGHLGPDVLDLPRRADRSSGDFLRAREHPGARMTCDAAREAMLACGVG
jgi:hypothetical protein